MIKEVKEDEITFLKYLIDCCENVLEKPTTIIGHEFEPCSLQLSKLRAEVTARLETVYGIKYGKFSKRTHLLAGT